MSTIATTWLDLYQLAAERLGSETEARWLVEEVSGDPPLAGTRTSVPARALARFESLTERRVAGEPLQYVLGRWGFRRLDLMVDRRVLIPRPETEQVVEAALAELDELDRANPGPDGTPRTVVDLGTGSGAIALAVASERPRTHVWATDVTADALAVASANLAGLGGYAASRVRLVQGSWWSALPPELAGRIDLAVSNPPYISSGEMDGLDPQVRAWEPRAALESGPTGTEAIEEILGDARTWLAPAGVLVIEVAPHQATRVVTVARDSGFPSSEVREDLAGRDRILVAKPQVAGAGGTR